MATFKRTIISAIEFDENGPTGIRLGLHKYDDEDKTSEIKYHRSVIQNGLSDEQVEAQNLARSTQGLEPMSPDEETFARRYVTTAEQMRDVNAHLARMGFPTVSVDQMAEIETYRQVFRTPTADLASLMSAAGLQAIEDAAEHLEVAMSAHALATARQEEIDELKRERDELTSLVTSTEAKVTALQGELDALRAPVVNGVPQEVAMNKARKALIIEGLFDQVDAAINAAEGQEGDLIRADWQYSTVMKRDAAFVLKMAELLGLSNETVDELFKKAAALP